jgi:hypothetical protein
MRWIAMDMDKCGSENCVQLFLTFGRKNYLDYFIRQGQMAAHVIS